MTAAALRVGYLGLGSNVGDRRAMLERAVAELPARGVDVLAASSVYETEPVGLVLDQPVGDRRAQALERLVGALLCDQVDDVADLCVVDRVLHAIGHGRVTVADVDAQVEQQPLSHLALGCRHPYMGEQREPGDLDRDLGLGMAFVVVLYLVVLVGVGHCAVTVAAVTERASWTGATSCTRKTRAPRS